MLFKLNRLCILFLILNHYSPMSRCDAKRPPSQAADAAVEGIGLGGSFVDVGGNAASPDGIQPWGIILICVGSFMAVVSVIIIITVWRYRSSTDDGNASTTGKKDLHPSPTKAISNDIPVGSPNSSHSADNALPAVETKQPSE
ncbi:uncharacterized protein LOC128220544 [Mya arenaria]|uniref:uncharacterized protein LOC128220544 n=1 Tax=Mya arenaria TaxID=6604 RepID=UPI0022E37B07|nr:uncharacterized protein LOC128220544 [Mya arenaria]